MTNTARIRKGALAYALIIAFLGWLGSPAAHAGSLQQIAALRPAQSQTPSQPAAAASAGVIGAVNPEATGKMPGGATHSLTLGENVALNERIKTGPGGQVFVIFYDGSSLTIGPKSNVVIDTFIFDPASSSGKIVLSSCRGVLRYIGGKISKHEDSVTLNTPSGAIGVRGGVFLIALSRSGNTITSR